MQSLIEVIPEPLQDQFPEFRNLVIFGTRDEPLFQLQNIQTLTNMERIRLDKDPYEINVDYVKAIIERSHNKKYEQNVLTEQGLYHVLFRGTTDLCKKFRKFVTLVLKELRIHQQVKLNDVIGKLKMLDMECEEQHEQMLEYKQNYECVLYEYKNIKQQIANYTYKLEEAENNVSSSENYELLTKLEKIKEKTMKPVYVKVVQPPEEIFDEFNEYDDFSMTEDMEVCYELSSSPTDSNYKLHVYKDVTVVQIKNLLTKVNNKTFRGSIDDLKFKIDSLL